MLCKQLEVFKHFINGVKPQLCQRQTPQCHSCTTCFGLQLILSQLYGDNCIRCLEKIDRFKQAPPTDNVKMYLCKYQYIKLFKVVVYLHLAFVFD